jgi:nucleoid-associated protein YgaU
MGLGDVAAGAVAGGIGGLAGGLLGLLGGNKLVHASLEVLEPPTGTATEPGKKLFEIPFQFNPNEFTIAKRVIWNTAAGQDAPANPVVKYGGIEPNSISLEMFLDATTTMDDSVVQAVSNLFLCCVPTVKSMNDKTPSAPWVRFSWGDKIQYLGYASDVTAKYTLFTQSGMPVRAICTINLKEAPVLPAGQNPTSGALAASAVHQVVAGDTLASISYQHYRNAVYWRAIADANGIDDPACLPLGESLRIPAASELPALRARA